MRSFGEKKWRLVLSTAAGVMVCLSAMGTPAVASIVTVRFDPPSQTVTLGDPFTVDIVADIDMPVVGWGLDFTPATLGIISLTGLPAIGADWLSAFAPDGDGLVGLASPLPPFNGSISGIGIVLATLSFSADTIGATDLVASITPGDLTEGFALDPTGFATVTFQPGVLTVIPEPSTLVLLVFVSLMFVRRKREPGAPPLPGVGGG